MFGFNLNEDDSAKHLMAIIIKENYMAKCIDIKAPYVLIGYNPLNENPMVFFDEPKPLYVEGVQGLVPKGTYPIVIDTMCVDDSINEVVEEIRRKM